ncbi:unnamed protein product [Auanema sp. JU1783]|nr:unnamed protein product [Auanema sp. JU1783]
MPLSTVHYSALPNDDEEDRMAKYNNEIEFGVPEGTFGSAFTYANYNDLDRMGYEAPKRYSQKTTKYNRFTYSHMFAREEDEIPPMNAVEMIIYGISVLLAAITLPFSLMFVLKFVSTSEKLVILRLGRAQKTKGPGVALVFPCIDSTHRINTSITAFNVPPQQIITIDRGLVELGATIFLKIRDPISAVCGVQDRNSSTRTLANTMLYRYISKKRICELTNPQDRKMISGDFQNELQSFTAQFGVEITNVELSEIKIIKEGENMGLAALSAVASSETGKQLWQVIEPALSEFAKANEGGESEILIDTKPSEDILIDLSPGLDIDQLVSVINLAIDEQLTRSIGKIFQVNCSGLAPMYIDLKHSPGTCALGQSNNPDVVFETTQLIFFQLIKKTLSPINAYMNGSLKIKGSIQDALSLKYLAERISELL